MALSMSYLIVQFSRKFIEQFNQRALWLVLICRLNLFQALYSVFTEKKNLVLVLDRTNWKFGGSNINILMLGICYKNIAIPVMFKMLDKRGNSHSEERIKLIEQYISWFGKDTIDCLLADREFIGEDWFDFE